MKKLGIKKRAPRKMTITFTADEKVHINLKKIARKHKTTVSETIRFAIENTYGVK